MMKSEVDRFIINIALIYTSLGVLYVAYEISLISLFLLIIIGFFLKFSRFQSKLPLVIYGLTFFLAMSSQKGLIISFPLAVISPLILKSNTFVPTEKEYTFLGPTSLRTMKCTLISLIFVLISPKIAIICAISLVSTFSFSLIYYYRLSKIKIEVYDQINTISIGKKATVTISVEAPLTTILLIYYRNDKKIHVVNNKDMIEIELFTGHIGKQIADIDIFVYDRFGFSRRLMKRLTIHYNVVPLTKNLIDTMRKRIIDLGELRYLIEPVELVVMELGETSTIMKSLESIHALQSTIHSIQYSYFSVFMKKMMETYKEIIIEKETESLKRARRGEYFGVRSYIPGDHVKDIHWKKSTSVGNLVVKEFVEPLEDIPDYTNQKTRPVIVFDFYAPNPVELDKNVFRLLKIIYNVSNYSLVKRICVIFVVGKHLVILKGKMIDILYQLYKLFTEINVFTHYSYGEIVRQTDEAINELLSQKRHPKPLSLFVVSHNKFSEKLIELLSKNNISPPNPIVLIYSEALKLRYSLLKHNLERFGFLVMSDINSLLISRGRTS